MPLNVSSYTREYLTPRNTLILGYVSINELMEAHDFVSSQYDTTDILRRIVSLFSNFRFFVCCLLLLQIIHLPIQNPIKAIQMFSAINLSRFLISYTLEWILNILKGCSQSCSLVVFPIDFISLVRIDSENRKNQYLILKMSSNEVTDVFKK